MSRAVSAATDVAVTASIDHLIAPIINPTTSNNVGIAIAISKVTRPRSSRDDTERTTNQIGQKTLNRATFENDCEESRETRGRKRRDGVFRGGSTAFERKREGVCHVISVRNRHDWCPHSDTRGGDWTVFVGWGKPLERKSMRSIALATATAALLLGSTPASALSTSFGVDIYMSSPTVQGTAVTTGLTTESFNALTLGACPATIAIGAISGDCLIENAGDYGGATNDPNVPTQTTGGSGSKYASTTSPSTEITIDLNESAKYLGLWWSAGSLGNIIEMYSEGELVALMDTGTLMEILAQDSVNTVGGAPVATSGYRGNPRNFTLAPTEPFLYLNLYGTGGASFDQIKLKGGGFEFDNITVSDRAQVPGTTEIGIQFIPGENEPPAEPLAKTGADSNSLLGLGMAAAGLTVAAVALRRKRAIV